MRRTVRALVLVGACLLALGAGPALAAEELCPMGGMMLKAEINKEKALDWAKDLRKVEVSEPDSDAWSVLTLSRTDDDIAILVTGKFVFFGVAGRGGEVHARDMEKAFGKDLKKLREVVRRDVGDLWKDGVLKITGGDVQPISNAAGLGVLEKDGGDWVLQTRDCQAVDLPTSGL